MECHTGQRAPEVGIAGITRIAAFARAGFLQHGPAAALASEASTAPAADYVRINALPADERRPRLQLLCGKNSSGTLTA